MLSIDDQRRLLTRSEMVWTPYDHVRISRKTGQWYMLAAPEPVAPDCLVKLGFTRAGTLSKWAIMLFSLDVNGPN